MKRFFLDELQITTVVSKKNIDKLFQMHEYFRFGKMDFNGFEMMKTGVGKSVEIVDYGINAEGIVYTLGILTRINRDFVF